MHSARERVQRGVRTITYVGAGIGFVAYLVFGVIPGLLYGGYAGVVLAGSLFGGPVEPTLVVRIITVGGILFGLLASMFLFLVVGAFLGSAAGLIARPVLWVMARRAEAADREAMEWEVIERQALERRGALEPAGSRPIIRVTRKPLPPEHGVPQEAEEAADSAR